MIWFTLLIPVLTVLILLWFYRKHVVWWEYLVVLILSIILTVLLNTIMVHSRTSDTEYLGYIVKDIRYYEPWNQYIHRMCSRKIGKITTYYDCSYVKYHDEYWTAVTSNGEYTISQSKYNYIKSKFRSPSIFLDMERNYHSIDGDCYINNWLGDKVVAESINIDNSYENKVIASHSIFKLQNISEEKATKLKLFTYPEINEYNQKAVLGFNIDERTSNQFKYINGHFGETYKFKSFVFVFKNQPLSIAHKQHSYLDGGNFNEFNIYIGIDSLTNKIQWVKSYSWCNEPVLATKLQSYMATKDSLDMLDLSNWLINNVNSNTWQKKSGHDFDYITIEVTEGQLEWIIFLLLCYNIGISIFVINNEESNIKDKYHW